MTLQELSEQELEQVNGAETCEILKARLEGKKWPPATLTESIFYRLSC